MVIGSGMIAKRFDSFNEDNKFLIFASGVSNSKSINEPDYERELKLLQDTIKNNMDKVFVYFSTCSIYDKEERNSRYILHKKDAEHIIQSQSSYYYIFRTSNVIGKSTNPNTVLNFFIYHIFNKINFDLWINATRNLIDIDDMYKIAAYIIQKNIYPNQIINLANPVSYTTLEIIAAIEALWNIKANYIQIAKGNPFTIDVSLLFPILKELSISFKEDYLINLLRKYYSDQ